MAVVLGHGIGAAPVHAAGDPAIGLLVFREPLDVGAHGLGVAQAEERRRRSARRRGSRSARRSAFPAGWRDRPAPRARRRGCCGAFAAAAAPRRARDLDAVKLFAPLSRAGGQPPREELAALAAASRLRRRGVGKASGWSGSSTETSSDPPGGALTVEGESTGGVAEAVARGWRGREPAARRGNR